jgi:hypothetical protein
MDFIVSVRDMEVVAIVTNCFVQGRLPRQRVVRCIVVYVMLAQTDASTTDTVKHLQPMSLLRRLQNSCSMEAQMFTCATLSFAVSSAINQLAVSLPPFYWLFSSYVQQRF